MLSVEKKHANTIFWQNILQVQLMKESPKQINYKEVPELKD